MLLGEGLGVAEQSFSKCLGDVSGFEALVNVLFSRLPKQGRPDKIKDCMFLGVVHQSTESSLSA